MNPLKQKFQHSSITPFDFAHTLGEFKQKVQLWNFPYVVKTATGKYNGKDQHVIHNRHDLIHLFQNLSCLPKFDPLIIGELIPIENKSDDNK